VLAGYEHPHFGRFPAAVTKEHGAGRITTVGTVPDQSFTRDLMRWLAPESRVRWGDLPASVTVSSATTSDGGRLHVVHNWSWDPQVVSTPTLMRDVLSQDGEHVEQLKLGSWDVRVLLEI
jgi:beta-galactosidase